MDILNKKLDSSALYRLFFLLLVIILSVYAYILGIPKSINLVLNEGIFIGVLLVLLPIRYYFKRKTKGLMIFDFNQNNNLNLKTTIGIFLVFQIIDFIMEDGFIGMISQWFIYWIMGFILLVVFDIVNFWRNLKIRGI